MGSHSAGRHARHSSNSGTSGTSASGSQRRDRRQPDGALPRQRAAVPDPLARRQAALAQARGERARATSATVRGSARPSSTAVRPTTPVPTTPVPTTPRPAAVAVWGSPQRLDQTVGMDTVTGPISESTTARVRREDARRSADRAASVRGGTPTRSAGAAAARGGGGRVGGRSGGSHRAAPGRGSARTKIAVAGTASIAGLSALVTGMTLSGPTGEANNGSGGPSVEAASLPGAFSAGAGQASRADRGDEPVVTPQVPAGPSSYDGVEEPLPDPASADYDTYGYTYDDGYDSYVPPSGDVVGDSIPVFPLTDPTGQPQNTDGTPATTGTTTQPGTTQPGTPTQPTATTPNTQPTTPTPTPTTGNPTTPGTTAPTTTPGQPSTTPSTPASPSPSGTALPFDPEDDDIVVDVPVFSLTPSGTP